jgi:Protein of unknown function (DUF4232)
MTSSATTAKVALAAVLASGVTLLAGCGSTASPAAGSPSTVTVTASPSTATTAPSTAGPSTSAGPPGCASSALRLSIGQGNGTAGSIIVPVQFTNTSSATCTMYGYPGVSFVTGAGGSVIGAPAGEDAAMPRKLITLAPGAEASAALQVVVAQNFPASKCKLAKAHWLQVYPPGQTAALYVKYSSDTCSSKSIRVLEVQTVQAGDGNP